ncbi:MAG: FGGY family carbohydrate kinase [Thiogranum sp.]
MDYILAIDQGTHASRALLLDQDGQVVARSLHPVSLARPRPGQVEQDAEQLLTATQAAVREVLQTLTGAQRGAVCACGISTQRSTVMSWQANGTALSAALSWQDTRGARQTGRLRNRAAAIRALSGLPLSAHYGASKLHWLYRLPDRPPGARLGPLAGFLLQRLTREHRYAVDHSNAQRMQLLDIHTLEWSPQLADWFNVPLDRLPPCHPVQHAYGTLAESGVPVTALCGDQNAAWFGSGRPDRNTALVNLGSGAFILAARAGAAAPAELLSSIAFSDQAHCEYLLEGTVNGAGSALQWLQSQWPDEDIRSGLPRWLEQVSDPPLFLNSVGGLGSPWWCQGPEPGFVPAHDTPDTARAAVAVTESILFLVRYNLEIMQQHQAITRLRVSGGLSQLDALCRKLANLTGLPLQRADDPEASARGIAWLAAGRPGNWRSPDNIQHFEPQPDSALADRYACFIEQLRARVDNPVNE